MLGDEQMKRLFIFLLAIICLFLTKNVWAANYIYVSGSSIGIKLNTDVEVLGTFGVNTENDVLKPWDNLIYEHDILKKVNGENIVSSSFLENKIQSSNGDDLNIVLLRHNEEHCVKVKPVKGNEGYSLGLYIKDCDLGIGTLTFCNEDGHFASLGHKMVDKEIKGGQLYYSNVTGIVKPRGNTPGEKRATFEKNVIGQISSNLKIGVYGTISDSKELQKMEKMELAHKEEAHKGRAYILTCVNSNTISSFEVEIKECLNQKKEEEKGLKLKITDSKLQNIAGGIVQGMSGSPIIQDGKLIGALSHVSIKNPLEGYGCYAEFMYENL